MRVSVVLASHLPGVAVSLPKLQQGCYIQQASKAESTKLARKLEKPIKK